MQPSFEVPDSIRIAREDLADALAGVQLSATDRRYLDWFVRTCDQPTHHAFASIIRAARAHGPAPHPALPPTANDPAANEAHGRRRT
jgi:citrate lyase beta subunit